MEEAATSVPRAPKEINLTPADIKRFWSKVDKLAGPNECWPWTDGKDSYGYGQMWAGRKNFKSHRVAWVIASGENPAELCVCHRCDNRKCCNPAHLFLGTTADNMSDRGSKGRQARGDRSGSRLHPERRARGGRNGAHTKPERRPRGEANGSSKLMASQVLTIRAIYAAGGITKMALGAQFGVKDSIIGKIINRKLWRHVS